MLRYTCCVHAQNHTLVSISYLHRSLSWSHTYTGPCLDLIPAPVLVLISYLHRSLSRSHTCTGPCLNLIPACLHQSLSWSHTQHSAGLQACGWYYGPSVVASTLVGVALPCCKALIKAYKELFVLFFFVLEWKNGPAKPDRPDHFCWPCNNHVPLYWYVCANVHEQKAKKFVEMRSTV